MTGRDRDLADQSDSRVRIASTATADLCGMAGLLRHRRGLRDAVPPRAPVLGRQVVRFAAIGVASTIAYVALYALLRHGLGPQPSNALALLATAVANTAANRRLTFEVRGGEGAVRAQIGGLLALAIALAITSASIGGLHAVASTASRAAEIVVLVAANAVATGVRFVVLRRVIERPVPVMIP